MCYVFVRDAGVLCHKVKHFQTIVLYFLSESFFRVAVVHVELAAVGDVLAAAPHAPLLGLHGPRPPPTTLSHRPCLRVHPIDEINKEVIQLVLVYFAVYTLYFKKFLVKFTF